MVPHIRSGGNGGSIVITSGNTIHPTGVASPMSNNDFFPQWLTERKGSWATPCGQPDTGGRAARGRRDRGVISHGDVMSLGAIQAIKAAHREGTVRISGIDGQQQGIERVADGSYEATVIYPVAVSAGVVAAAKACVGEPLPERVPLDYPLVTRAEVEQYLGTTYG